MLHKYHSFEEVDNYYVPPGCFLMGNYKLYKDIQNKVVVTGIPLSPFFWSKYDKSLLRKKLNMDPSRLTILISFGGEGIGGERNLRMLKKLFDSPLPVQYVIIAGKNKIFERKICSLINDLHDIERFIIYGYVENMFQLLNVADVFIGKAGGLSISEALSHDLPVGIMGELPGQEKYNADFIEKNNLGVRIDNVNALVSWIYSIMSINHISDFACRSQLFARPLSGYYIVKHIINSVSF